MITLDQACELALINSREFQDRREDLYLAALPVTLQRFAFTTQFFATEEVIREYTGRQTPEGQGNRWRGNSAVGFSKLFPTAALLLVRYANQVVINMSDVAGPRVVTPSTLTLDFAQPLLQGGGKAVTLEPLTQTERNLLYVMRNFAHFRKEFFVFIASGGNFTNAFAPGSPLGASSIPPNEGFLSTVLRDALLDNAHLNVRYLESILALYKELLRGGDVSPLQVDQVELDLLNSQSSVLVQTNLLRDALDRFKIQLGLPTNVPLELDDSALRPLVTQQRRFLDIVSEFDSIRAKIRGSDVTTNPEQFLEQVRTWGTNPEQFRQQLLQWATEVPLARGTTFAEEFPRRWRELQPLSDDQLKQRTASLMEERRQLLRRNAELKSEGRSLSDEEQNRLSELDRDIDLVGFETDLREFFTQPWTVATDPERRAAIRAIHYRRVVSSFVVVIGEARNERIEQAKKRWPKLPDTRLSGIDLITDDFDLAIATASQAALTNRFDLMNARGRVVDNWRQITVQANSLMGVLDVHYHMDAANNPVGTQPFEFEGSRTRHQLILNGELPLVRQAERNAYRTALIAFQRSRRSLQFAEDDVLRAVRSELRQLRVLSENYKIQQRAVELSYNQVENSLNVLQAPPRPVPGGGAGGGGGSQGSGTGSDSGSQAALTRQLLDAVSRLLQAQNQLYTVYINYNVVRLQLYRDMELMNLDSRGVWIDGQTDSASTGNPGANDSNLADPATKRLPPAPDTLPAILPGAEHP